MEQPIAAFFSEDFGKQAGVVVLEMATEQSSAQEEAQERIILEMATEQSSTQEEAQEMIVLEPVTQHSSTQEEAQEMIVLETVTQHSSTEEEDEERIILEMTTVQSSTQEDQEMTMNDDDEDSSSSATDISDAEEDEGSEVDPDKLESESDSSEDSCEEESEGEINEITTRWTSKNGKIVWSPTNEETLRYVPKAKGFIPGPTRYALARISDPLSSFALLLTDEILEHIVEATNLHGRRAIAGWRDLSKEELQAYVGLLALAGVYRSKHESTLSLWSEKSGRPIFRATMSHTRFHIISQTLCFDIEQTQRKSRDDRMASFRKVWDMWSRRLPMLFNPDTDICVDEQLVPFRGRCSFRQYMPKKPARYGIKIWATCDVKTSYAWKLQVYLGKKPGAPSEVNQGMRVVLDMTEGLKGHVVTCDNFFTSFALTEELLKRKMALVGTIRKNKPELPPHLLQLKQRALFSSMFAFTKNHTLVSYTQRRGKNVLLLSTKHRSPDISNETKKKPIIIKDYNKCKGGVDNLDKVVGTYSCRRKTNRWQLALFHNVVDVSLYNAFVLWKSFDPTWQQKLYCRRLYIEEVGEMLVTPHIKKREHLPRSSAASELVTKLQGNEPGPSPTKKPKGRKRCKFCPGNKKRKTGTICCKCGKFTCKDHSLIICGPCGSPYLDT